MKSGACECPGRNPAEIDFPLVPTALGTNGASAGGRPPPGGAPAPSGFSTAVIHPHRSTTRDGTATGRRIKIPQMSHDCAAARYPKLSPTLLRLAVLSTQHAIGPDSSRMSDGGSSNGRTADSDSASLGSNPSPPANLSNDDLISERPVRTRL